MSGGIALSWSGGKDSAFALHELRRRRVEPRVLVATVTEGHERVSMHGVRRDLLASQAKAVGVDLVEVVIPAECTNDVYDARMAGAFATTQLADVEAVAFGDLFLEDVRRYREERLAAAGKRALFPLWGRDTGELASEFVAAGFEAVLVCIDPLALHPSFAGRAYDANALEDLPAGVDPCGENGEFHTFVSWGPGFSGRVGYRLGASVERAGFVFRDLIPV